MPATAAAEAPITGTPRPLADRTAPSPAEPVALIADEITYDSVKGILRATGNVQVFQGGRTLTADEITYDSNAERIDAVGTITLRTARGETVYADMASLDTDLRNGMIQGAQSVIAGDGKISAVEARRVEGRYNILEKAVFSPCEVCTDHPVPLWRIRAERIIHDQEEREIHYEDAYFDVFGVPIAFLPYFRHPSPEVERATGFLSPEIGRSRAFGAFLRSPYFIVLDPYSDVTLTPFITSGDGAILEAEYRRRYENGFVDLQVFTGVTDYDDDGIGARFRLGVFGEGLFEVDEGANAGFNLAFAADDPFLRRYNYTENDRLFSDLFIRGYDGANFATANLGFIQGLRDGEAQDTIPIALPEISLRHVMPVAAVGGEFGVSLDGRGLLRIDGRDVGQLSLGADWSREHILPSGLVLRGFAETLADVYVIGDDAAFNDTAARFVPRFGVEARMPFVRAGVGSAIHVIEPIAQFTYAPNVRDDDIPNEDSVLVEFDEVNLFETDRFAGLDRVETGAYATLGAKYELIDPDALGLRLTAGRVFRAETNGDFTDESGIADDLSDYVGAASLTYDDWFEFRTRWRLSSGFNFNRAEAGGRINYNPLTLFGYYLFVDADPAEGAFEDRSEISLGAALRVDRNWTVSGDVRRDLITDDFVTAGGVLSYEDECAGLDFYIRQQFAESLSTEQGTSVGVTVRLFGAGTGDPGKASNACAYGAQ
ncbi:MAG: LPS assembly protein LptD [Pseudomonadota bacterium]